MGYQSMEDWYSIRQDALQENGGHSLLNFYQWSPCLAVTDLFDDHKWELWKFARVPSVLFRKSENITLYIQHLEDHLKIEKPQEWCRVSQAQVSRIGKFGSLKKMDGLHQVLKVVYPSLDWEKMRAMANKKATQRYLMTKLREIFPNLEIIEEHILPELISVDLFIPKLNLCVE
jgi:hypothetical protein